MSRIPIDENNVNGEQDGQEAAVPEEAAEAGGITPSSAAPRDLQKLQEERDNLYQRLLRVSADFKNSQRRLEQEKDQAVQFANTNLIKSLLPVIDDFERVLAVDGEKADLSSVLKGMQIVHDHWMKVLGQQDVEEIAPQPGEPFDPNRHKALMEQPDDRYDQTTVVQLLQKGYALHGRTLRPAAVAVSKST